MVCDGNFFVRVRTSRSRVPRQPRRRSQTPPLSAKLQRDQHGKFEPCGRVALSRSNARRRLHKAHLRPPGRSCSALVATSLIFMSVAFGFGIWTAV
jgi:hypothetical protein